ncbi:hypothetical protein, partial [Pseudomonas amygdali]|uniref:hypothetical protein n=1 Tax=Pseudomonas amygdali TaxID=47877 RepID=UPI001F2DB827
LSTPSKGAMIAPNPRPHCPIRTPNSIPLVSELFSVIALKASLVIARYTAWNTEIEAEVTEDSVLAHIKFSFTDGGRKN